MPLLYASSKRLTSYPGWWDYCEDSSPK